MRYSFSRLVWTLCLFAVAAPCTSAQPGGPAGKPNGPAGPGNATPTANQAAYSPYDVVTSQFKAQGFTPETPPAWCTKPDGKGSSLPASASEALAEFASSSTDAPCVLDLILNENTKTTTSAFPGEKDVLTKGNGIILHVMTWTLQGTEYQPQSGAWGFYTVDDDYQDGKPASVTQRTDLSSTPYFYNAPHIYLIDMNFIPIDVSSPTAEFDYAVTFTARQKQNQSDFATLVSSVLKLPSQTGTMNDKSVPPQTSFWGTVDELLPSVPVPYDVAVTVALNSTQPASKSPPQICTASPCSVSKTVTHLDSEYWDVSLGLAVPGPVETTYKSSTSAGTTTITSAKVTHTDAYAFIDIYPFERLAHAPSTFAAWPPHINFGMPITSQPLHRTYAGLAQNLSFLTKTLKLNVPISAFAGAVFMKQQLEVPGTTPSLVWDWAVKPMFGVEISIGSIASYLKSGGGSGGQKNSPASKTAPGGSQ